MIVCIYAIMRDERDNVAAWAETTGDADRRFVLDTGSQDATAAELGLHGVAVTAATFAPFRFDDARNAALALAPEADLYFRLDADERLPANWRETLEAAYHPNISRYRYSVVNHGRGWGRITRDDLHRRWGFRWRYPTHEILVGPTAAMPVGITVTHHPPATLRPHHRDNLAVLAAAVTEYPGDHRMAFYYGRELWYQNRWDECRLQMQRFLELPGGWPPERAEAWRILAAIDDFPERWLWRAIGECPERREPWCDLARHYLAAERPEPAVLAVNFAYHRDDESIYTTDQSCWGEAFDELVTRVSGIDPDVAHAAEP